MKRNQNESFENYKKRRKEANKKAKKRLGYWRWISTAPPSFDMYRPKGRTYRKDRGKLIGNL